MIEIPVRGRIDKTELVRADTHYPKGHLAIIDAAARELDYHRADVLRAIVRWAIDHAVLVSPRGRYHFLTDAETRPSE